MAEAFLPTKWLLDPSGRLPQQTWTENLRGAVPLLSGSWVPKTPHLTQYGRAEAYLHAEFHIDPSNRLARIHQRYRQTAQEYRQERQSSDSIGRTVLQTVTQILLQY